MKEVSELPLSYIPTSRYHKSMNIEIREVVQLEGEIIEKQQSN